MQDEVFPGTIGGLICVCHVEKVGLIGVCHIEKVVLIGVCMCVPGVCVCTWWIAEEPSYLCRMKCSQVAHRGIGYPTRLHFGYSMHTCIQIQIWLGNTIHYVIWLFYAYMHTAILCSTLILFYVPCYSTFLFYTYPILSRSRPLRPYLLQPSQHVLPRYPPSSGSDGLLHSR
jgi:hypothetical protein